MDRVLEPEVMDAAEEAADYDSMDHGAVNVRFSEDLLVQSPLGERILDLGTGTALIPIELCRRSPSGHVTAIDLAQHMLTLARRNVARAGYSDRITLEAVDAKAMPYADASFDAVISNSIVHHVPDPRAVLTEVQRVTASGGLIFLRDLSRPPNEAEVDRLVSLYGGEPPADPSRQSSFEHQRALFRASLHAALTIEEVAAIARETRLEGFSVRATSDRHWTLIARKP
jgi:ubiquinone/menaquinone biosynthesis C-methylase UbiE